MLTPSLVLYTLSGVRSSSRLTPITESTIEKVTMTHALNEQIRNDESGHSEE